MKHTKYFMLSVIAVTVFAFAQIAQGQTEGKLANMSVGAGSVRWDILVAKWWRNTHDHCSRRAVIP